MGSPLENAVSHGARRQTRVIEVPEWGDENGPLLIYVQPWTMSEKGKAFALMQKNGLAGMVDVLQFKATDSEGKLIFQLGDRARLKNDADPDVITRIVEEMTEGLQDDAAGKGPAAKN